MSSIPSQEGLQFIITEDQQNSIIDVNAINQDLAFDEINNNNIYYNTISGNNSNLANEHK